MLAGAATVVALMPTRALGQTVPVVSESVAASASWDARLTSMLVLLLLYVGYLSIATSDHSERVKVASAWIALIGAINLPIIKFSVDWWNTLHQGESIFRSGGPSIASSMLTPLLLMIAAFTAFGLALLLLRMGISLKETKLRRLQMARRGANRAAN